jgi:hypothetical protein
METVKDADTLNQEPLPMTELVHVTDLVDGTPGTHAIVIGIGTYPSGGDVAETAALADLKSPPRTAVAVADWLICEYNNPCRPLASVSLIISEEEPFLYRNPVTGVEHEVPRGTSDDLKRCVRDWAERARSNFENGAIFYFCGHGLSSGQRNCLLSRSFGDDSFNHLSGAFDRASVVTSMRLFGPKQQLFLFDACRTECPELLKSGEPATPFLSPRPGQFSSGPVEQCSLLATAEGAGAFGAAHGISIFATEFLKACRSAAEERGGWWIRTHLVLRHMKRFLRGQACQFEGDDVDVHRLTGNPAIPVTISCDPSEHISSARLEIRRGGATVIQFDGNCQLDVDAWHLSLESGSYRVAATACICSGFEPFECPEFLVYPPFADIIVDMARRAVAR